MAVKSMLYAQHMYRSSHSTSISARQHEKMDEHSCIPAGKGRKQATLIMQREALPGAAKRIQQAEQGTTAGMHQAALLLDPGHSCFWIHLAQDALHEHLTRHSHPGHLHGKLLVMPLHCMLSWGHG